MADHFLWTNDEIVALKAMIDAGKLIPEIARTLGRSQEATRAKATKQGWYAYPSRLFPGPLPRGLP